MGNEKKRKQTPAHKRPSEAVYEEDDPVEQDHSGNHEQHDHHRHRDEDDDDDNDAADESYRGPSSSDGEKEEYVMINLSEVRKELQCPICLGIIRKTRTVMECLHRFCRECIDKSMRLGNNECPACRTHCASRRSLRDDPNYDALIAVLYPDIAECEEEELAFNEEEKARNKQSNFLRGFDGETPVEYRFDNLSMPIQDTIAQTVKRQSEASSRKRSSTRAASEIVRKSRVNLRDTPLRGRRNRRTELQACEDSDDNSDDGGRDSSSADERCTEAKPKRSKRSGGARSSQPSLAERGIDENGLDEVREPTGTVGGLERPSERLAWGKGGMRSHTRHGNGSGGNGKNARNSHVSRLVGYLGNLKEENDELDIHLLLISINEQTIPNLLQPYLCCRSTLSVARLCQYVALRTDSQADEIEIFLVKELKSKLNPSRAIDPSKDTLQILKEEDNLAELGTYDFNQGYVLLAYQRKLQTCNR